MVRHSPSLSRSATNADQGEDAGRPVARKASSKSVFILSLKPAGYIYPSQTYPEQRQSREERCSAWDIYPNLYKRQKMHTVSQRYQPNASTFLDIYRARLWFSLQFILFTEKKTQIGKQHIEGHLASAGVRRREEEGDLLDRSNAYLPNKCFIAAQKAIK